MIETDPFSVNQEPPLTFTKEELATAMQSGDQRAIVYLYENYKAMMVGMAYRFVKDEAEDLVQTVFARLLHLRGRGCYDGRCPVSAWLYVCVKNASINHLRGNSGHYLRGKESLDRVEESAKQTHLDNRCSLNDQSFLKIIANDFLDKNTDPTERRFFDDYLAGFRPYEIAERRGVKTSRARHIVDRVRRAVGMRFNGRTTSQKLESQESFS